MQAPAEAPADEMEAVQEDGNEQAAEAPPASPLVRLACAEVGNFRRLAQVRLDFDECTTVLVGANNSGKTSLLTVLRNFLSDSPAFRSFDISLAQWSELRQLGDAWEALSENPSTHAKDPEVWEKQLQKLLSCMPFADLWFDAQEGAYHHVAPFITSLMWSGGAVGIRLRLEPASNADAPSRNPRREIDMVKAP